MMNTIEIKHEKPKLNISTTPFPTANSKQKVQ